MDKNKQAILMLSTYFAPPKKGDPTPLTPLEYGRFALWLRENKYQPKDLFSQFDEMLNKWKDKKNKITRERLSFLIGRGMAMGVALEKWYSAGIWVITRSDTEYPKRLKTHLGDNAPALLFGVGNKNLLNAGGLSMVGSRNIDTSDQEFTQCIAKQASMEGLNIVSGGARGVDETAMLASLEVDGTATGILANDLFNAALSSKWRKHLRQNQLVLLSTYYPEASFNVGNAMGRNKYIYCLSDYALIVRSDEGKGGTWAGANENLKKNWIPLFVKDPSDAAGNIALKKMGANSLRRINTQKGENKDWLLNQLKDDNKSDDREAIVTKYEDNNNYSDSIKNQITSIKHPVNTEEKQDKISKLNKDDAKLINSNTIPQEPNYDQADLFYLYFIHYLEYLLENQNQITLSTLKELRKDLTQKQITDWLDRATEEELIIRQGKKRLYSKKETDLFSQLND
ncbi:MAG: DNA-protecting protein DprA [Candidatus Brocadiales bacterium]|nr:DNA-protecting protein DprA [Candidatus Brocadiales bacterium]